MVHFTADPTQAAPAPVASDSFRHSVNHLFVGPLSCEEPDADPQSLEHWWQHRCAAASPRPQVALPAGKLWHADELHWMQLRSHRDVTMPAQYSDALLLLQHRLDWLRVPETLWSHLSRLLRVSAYCASHGGLIKRVSLLDFALLPHFLAQRSGHAEEIRTAVVEALLAALGRDDLHEDLTHLEAEGSAAHCVFLPTADNQAFLEALKHRAGERYIVQ
jgi:hypothetical protein